MDKLLEAIEGKRVLVLGDTMLDEYIWGEVRRISPEAPVPVVAVRSRNCVPGGAGNTARNIASLGGHALLVSVIGGDTQATRLRAALEQPGLDLEGLLVDADRATTTKTRIVAHHQHVVRIDDEELTPLSGELEDRLLRSLEQQLSSAQACVLSDYGKGVVSARVAQHFIGLARAAGKQIVVDPKGADYAKYRGATVVKPNIDEARLVCPQVADSGPRTRGSRQTQTAACDAGLLNLAQAVLNLLNAGNDQSGGLRPTALLLTRGPEGMCLFEPGAAPLHIASMARDVFDVTGAGDTVAGTLALALAAGASLAEASQLANRAAGIVVGKVGTAQATRAELMG
jgi:D-beta-D-heptose 7-phosphate kinase/D-beta-D-heptose 1-phosphate adenosyltransferase